MTDVRDAVLFISEEDDNSPVTGVEDSDDEDSRSQTLYTVDDIEEGLRQFERQRHAEVTDQPKLPDSEVAEPISILEMVSKSAPVEERPGAPSNGTDRLYTIEDILEALEVEDGELSLKDEQEKNTSLRAEESKTTARAMRERCRKRMKEEERRIRKRTWRKYSLDDLKSEKMIAGLSGEKRASVEKDDVKEKKLSVRLSHLGGDKQEQMTESEDKTANLVSSAEKNRERRNAFFSSEIVKTSVASSAYESMGDVSKSLVSAALPALDDRVSVVLSSHDVTVGDACDRKCTAFLPQRKDVIPVAGEIEVSTCNVTTNSFNCPLTEKTRRMVVHQRPHPTRCDIADVTRYEDGHKCVSHVSHSKYAKCQAKSARGNGIRESSTSACNILGASLENADVRPPKNGRVPHQEDKLTESDSHSHSGSEEIDVSAHEKDMDKANLNAKGKFRRLFSGFMRACRRLCCVSSNSSSEE